MSWESGECQPPGITVSLSPEDAEALVATLRQFTEGAQTMAAAWAQAGPWLAAAIASAMPPLPPDPDESDESSRVHLRALPGGD